jgi:hypothetical protein
LIILSIRVREETSSARVFIMNTISYRELEPFRQKWGYGSSALGRNRMHDEYSPGGDRCRAEREQLEGFNVFHLKARI